MTEKMLTPDDAAELLQVSPNTVRGWLRKGVIKGTKVGEGRLWRISEATINDYVLSASNNIKQEGCK